MLIMVPHDPVTAIIPDADLDRILPEMEKSVQNWVPGFDRANPVSCAALRGAMADQLVPALACLNKAAIELCAVMALWCTLNHPRDGGVMRARMEHFRKDGRAPHFTMCRGTSGTYATALGDGYVDLRAHADRRVPWGATIVGAT